MRPGYKNILKYILVLGLSSLTFINHADAGGLFNLGMMKGPPLLFPSGAVVPFNSATCPSGWTIFASAKGRVIVGAGSGNTDSAGASLTSRAANSTGGLEYTTGIVVTSTAGTVGGPNGNFLGACGTSGAIPTAQNLYCSPGANATTVNGVAADSNIPPYVVRTYCRKN